MSWVKTNQLHALLAMPASLRSVLVGTSPRLRPNPTYLPLVNFRHYAHPRKRKGDAVEIAALSFPEYSPAGKIGQVKHISHAELGERFSLIPFSDLDLNKGLSALFKYNAPQLHDATGNFYLLKKNTFIPEVCVLGRSNVGKSSFVNGVAHMFRRDLAPTSKKAGRTKTMMLYGFGPPPSIDDLASQEPGIRGTEKFPRFSLYIADMPGYGENSLESWGDNIIKYLEKRTNLKGAIVLIDGVVGPKATDEKILRILCSLEISTSIVLTKVDKAGEWVNRLRQTVSKLHQLSRRIQKEQVEKNWPVDKIVYCTACGARETDLLFSTLSTARMVVARQAGLATYNPPDTDSDKKWTGKVVPFENLSNETNQDALTAATNIKTENTSSGTQSSQLIFNKYDAPAKKLTSAGPKLASDLIGSSNSWSTFESPSKTSTRAFHSGTARPRDQIVFGRLNEGPKRNSQKSQKSPRNFGSDIFDAFIDGLKSSSTKGNYVRNLRDQYDWKTPAPAARGNRGGEKPSYRFLDVSKRTEKVKVNRLAATETRQPPDTRAQNRKTARQAAPSDDDDWSMPMPTPSRKNKGSAASDDIITPDAFKAMVTSSDPLPPTKGSKKGKKGAKGAKGTKGKKGKAAKVEVPKPVDPFEAKFSQAFTSSKKHVGGSSSF
ncbi:hypothetical protein F4805DRAFT_54944 [Annulohypoxylon moriforme]|nr:hypothetical protein F4805DRAFT_54944 [Annulohypoxylon moriforme]